MINSHWIKNLYKFEKSTSTSIVPKLVGIALAFAIALNFYVTQGLWVPLLIPLLLLILLALRINTKAFDFLLSYALFILFQTFTLLVLTLIFYFVISPIAVFLKLTQKNSGFFMNENKQTIQLNPPNQIDFERQF